MKNKNSSGAVIVLTLILTAIWYLLSGKFDLLHFGTGVVAALAISMSIRPVADPTPFRLDRFLLYVPWLIGQVVVSNLRVARMVLSPRMPIAPSFLAQAPRVTGPRALTTLGCSITLTPGTLTVDVGTDEIFIHALDTVSAQDARDGVIAARVRGVFPVETS